MSAPRHDPTGELHPARREVNGLQQQLNNWHHILTHSRWPIALSDHTLTHVADCNDAYAQLHGYSRDELVGKPIASLFAPEERERLQAVFNVLEACGNHQFEGVRLRKDGTRFPASMNLTNCIDESGRVTQRAVLVFDLTAQKRAQTALQQAQDELERKVAERTRELERANEQLKDLDRLKSEFLASMSHELRTPLNSIIGFTDLMLSGLTGDLNAEQRKQMSLVYGAGQHLLALINDLLDVSRIEAGRMDVSLDSVDLHDVIHQAADIVRPMMDERRLRFDLTMDKAPLIVVSDEKKLRQVLLNLLSNAAKYTERGCVRVESGVHDGAPWVSVEDTGCGIEEHNIDQLFLPFRQIGPTTQEGTGLGLYLSRKLMGLLGGNIEVSSEFGRGSRFTVRLPS